MLLPILQWSVLILLAVLAVEFAVWSAWSGEATTKIVLGVLVAYAGLLSLCLLGDQGAWIPKVFRGVWNVCLSSRIRAGATLAVVSVMVGLMGILVLKSRHADLKGVVLYEQKPLPEGEQFQGLLRTPDGEEVRFVPTDKGWFTVRVRREDIGKPLLITGESEHYRTPEALAVTTAFASVKVEQRQKVTVEVKRRGGSGDGGTPTLVALQEVGIQKRRLPPQRVDTDNLAYFEAGIGPWKVIVDAGQKRYVKNLEITKLPFAFVADLNDKTWEETGQSAAEVLNAVVSLARLPAPFGVGITGVSEPLPPVEADQFELLKWVPRVSRALAKPGFIASYSDQLKIPLWVAYRVNYTPSYRRSPDRIEADREVPSEVAATVQDYAGSGYDRGHLVRMSDVSGYGPEAVRAANLLTAMCPQTPSLNRGAWMLLEDYARELAADLKGDVFVIAGPAFVGNGRGDVEFATIGRNHVAVPTHLFRILVARSAGQIKVLSFLIPNSPLIPKQIAPYLVSVAAIEQVTGLTFFRGMPADDAARLKEQVPHELWPANKSAASSAAPAAPSKD
ncbi:MAG TPA: DNA/RNA non-specific endonuclease [Tepidisphaeraceae bacterium]|jgi:endonuclease G